MVLLSFSFITYYTNFSSKRMLDKIYKIHLKQKKYIYGDKF